MKKVNSSSANNLNTWQDRFLVLLPAIQRHLRPLLGTSRLRQGSMRSMTQPFILCLPTTACMIKDAPKLRPRPPWRGMRRSKSVSDVLLAPT